MEEAIALENIQAIAASFGASFDAEKIVDTVLEKDGTRYYKVRWVKYSWEPAASFTHLEHLINEFWNQFGQTQEPIDNDRSKRQIDPKQQLSITQELPTQVQLQPHSHSDRPNLNSILTTLSSLEPMVNTVTQVQAATTIHIQPNLQLQGSFPQLAAIDTTTTQQVEILPSIQQIQINSNQGLLHSNSTDFGDINATLKVASTVKSSQAAAGETSKKRRKIPGNCPICGKHFKSTTNIAAHKKLHTEERQFECPECNRKFRRKLHLRRHLESHAGIKSFLCNICGASFSSKWYMQSHALIHTGDKPYQCDICQKCFNNKANLSKHKLIHANKRPFVCNVCGHSYRQSYDLKRHMSTHSNDKEFTCEQCGKSFARKTYLHRHMLTHNGEKKFACHLCNRKFFQKGHLNFHLKNHGKNKTTSRQQSELDLAIEQPRAQQVIGGNDIGVAGADDTSRNELQYVVSEGTDEIGLIARGVVPLKESVEEPSDAIHSVFHKSAKNSSSGIYCADTNSISIEPFSKLSIVREHTESTRVTEHDNSKDLSTAFFTTDAISNANNSIVLAERETLEEAVCDKDEYYPDHEDVLEFPSSKQGDNVYL